MCYAYITSGSLRSVDVLPQCSLPFLRLLFFTGALTTPGTWKCSSTSSDIGIQHSLDRKRTICLARIQNQLQVPFIIHKRYILSPVPKQRVQIFPNPPILLFIPMSCWTHQEIFSPLLSANLRENVVSAGEKSLFFRAFFHLTISTHHSTKAWEEGPVDD